jgi:tetratricopeptide (TPR) repeat protein
VLSIVLFSFLAACGEDLNPVTLALQQNDPAKALALLNPLRSECGQASEFYELLGLANELSGNAPGAEEALRTAVSLDPKSPRVLTELGATYLRNGKPTEAAKVLDQALALDPSSVATVKYAIGAAVQLRAWERAAGLFQQIGAEKNPAALQQEPVLFLWLAQTLIETNRKDQVDSLLLPKRNPMSPELLFSLGTLFARYRMYVRAVDCLKRVPPQSADDAVYFNLGLSYSHLRRFDEARKCYFLAADKHPGHPDVYFHVGLDYTASGDPRMAIPWLFHAHKLAAARADISYSLVELLLQLEYFNTAQEILGQALDTHPGDALLLTAEGDLKRAQGNVAPAIDSYHNALAQQPGLTAALVGLARANISQGKDKEAKIFLKDALSGATEDPSANGELGLLEAHEGDWHAALEHLKRAWTQDRSNTNIALELARAYRRMDRPMDALQLLNSIGPVMRESSAFHLELAQIYTQLRRPAEARAERDAVSNLQAQTKSALLRFESPRTYVH